MALCVNCPHDLVDHDDDGCRYGRATVHSCRCLFSGKGKGIVLMGAKYEDARPTANPKRTTSTMETIEVLKAERAKAADTQVGGEHYRQTPIQPWEVIDAWGLDFYAGSALKYLYRAGRKGPKLEDLKKLRHYIDKMIEKEEG